MVCQANETEQFLTYTLRQHVTKENPVVGHAYWARDHSSRNRGKEGKFYFMSNYMSTTTLNQNSWYS